MNSLISAVLLVFILAIANRAVAFNRLGEWVKEELEGPPSPAAAINQLKQEFSSEKHQLEDQLRMKNNLLAKQASEEGKLKASLSEYEQEAARLRSILKDEIALETKERETQKETEILLNKALEENQNLKHKEKLVFTVTASTTNTVTSFLVQTLFSTSRFLSTTLPLVASATASPTSTPTASPLPTTPDGIVNCVCNFPPPPAMSGAPDKQHILVVTPSLIAEVADKWSQLNSSPKKRR